MHGDDFTGMNDFDGQARGRAVAREFSFQDVFRTDQQHTRAILARRLYRALDLRLGRTVRTHRIQRDHARHV